MQIGEQNLPLAQHLALDGLGLLDLDDHVGGGKDLFGRADDLRARSRVSRVFKPRTYACARLYQDGVAVRHGLLCGVGCDPDAEFLWFDLCWTSDFHLPFPVLQYDAQFIAFRSQEPTKGPSPFAPFVE